MKVGILSQWFPPETGPASIPGVLARGLVERGHEVTVLTGFPNYPTGGLYEGYRIRPRQDSEQDGYAIRRVALYPDHSSRISGRLFNYGSFAASATAVGTSALKGIDVLWVYNSPATVALPMWLAKARYHVPIVLHNMDMWPDSVIHTGFAPKRGTAAAVKCLNAWVDAMYRSATTIAYISESAGEELQRRGVPAAKLRYAPVWVDEAVFRPVDGSRLRQKLGFQDDDVVVGYAGALGKAQGVLQLVSAVASLPESSPVKCLVLGSGTEAHELAKIAENHPAQVLFLGHVPHSAMSEFAAVPDISFVGVSPGGQQAFAAPSKIPAIMACGKPILAAAAGDSASLVQRSGAGLVVPPGDFAALRQALLHLGAAGREDLKSLGDRARRFYIDDRSEGVTIERIERLIAQAAVDADSHHQNSG